MALLRSFSVIGEKFCAAFNTAGNNIKSPTEAIAATPGVERAKRTPRSIRLSSVSGLYQQRCDEMLSPHGSRATDLIIWTPTSFFDNT